MSEEEDIIEELKTSYKKYGPVRHVVKTQFGIAAGETRKKAVPKWPEKTINVKDYYAHLKLKVADNLHKRKGPEWWVAVLKDAAEELMKQGVEKGKVAARLEQDFPLSKRSIYRYLPQESKFPEPQQLAEGKAASATVALQKEIDTVSISHEKIEPDESKVKSSPTNHQPRQSDNVKSSYTDTEMILINQLGKAGVKYKTQVSYERPEEFTSDNQPKNYVLNILVEDYLGLEVEGAETDRDQFFKDKGITIVHLPTAMVLNYGDVVATLVALITKDK